MGQPCSSAACSQACCEQSALCLRLQHRLRLCAVCSGGSRGSSAHRLQSVRCLPAVSLDFTVSHCWCHTTSRYTVSRAQEAGVGPASNPLVPACQTPVSARSLACCCALQGRRVTSRPHLNLSLQQLQPRFQLASRVSVCMGAASGEGISVRLSHVEASLCTHCAYQGLSCLQISGDLPRARPHHSSLQWHGEG